MCEYEGLYNMADYNKHFIEDTGHIHQIKCLKQVKNIVVIFRAKLNCLLNNHLKFVSL